jgi:hypothetical protein
MDIQKMIEELRTERECLDGALMNLHRLALKRAPRRGRPPSWDGLAAAVAKKPQRVATRRLQRVPGSKVLTVGVG